MEKKIIFLPTYDYLSIPQLNQIIPKLTEFDCYILYLKDPYYTSYHFVKQYTQFTNVIEEKMISPILNESFKHSTKDSFLDKLKVFKKFRTDVENHLNLINPDIIFGLSDKSFGQRIAQKWCFNNKKSYVVHQPAFIDGFISSFEKKYTLSTVMSTIRRKLINLIMGIPKIRNNGIWGMEYKDSKVLLWSEYFNYFTTLSPKKHVFYVGNPGFDNLFIQFRKKNKTIKTVLICTQPSVGIFDKKQVKLIDYGFRNLIRSYPEIFFFVKVHPREDIVYYRDLFADIKTDNFEVTQDNTVLYYIEKSELQISVNSFTSMEAAAFGIPIITFVPTNLDDKIIDHYKGEINLQAKDEKELIYMVGDFISDPNKVGEFYKKRETYFGKYFLSLDGNSAERVVKVLKDISS